MAQQMPDRYMEVTYVTVYGGAGTVRRWLSEIPGWLAVNKGAMIVALRDI